MNSTLVIARREVVEKRFVFVTALAFLALALGIAFMPGVHAGERGPVLVVASLVLAAVLTIGLAAILGSSIVGRELGDGRLSFYFSKPVPATSIWWGKLLAAAVLILGVFVIVGLPALIAGSAAVLTTWTSRGSLWVFEAILAIAAALFLLTHVVGTFVRSRSAWFLFDFIAAVVCGVGLSMLARTLLAGSAELLTAVLGRIFVVFIAAVVIAAGAWQIARGRTDRTRSHLELSRFLWVSIGCGVLVVAAFVGWVAAVGPGDLINQRAVPSGGDWAFIEGLGKNRVDYHAIFLYNIKTSRAFRVRGVLQWWQFGLTPSGSNAFWLVRTTAAEELWVARLDSSDPRPMKTPVAVKNVSFYNLSPDGSRFAVIDHQSILSVYDVAGGDLLGSVRIPAGEYWFGFFSSPDVVRIYANERRGPSAIFEFDVRKKHLTSTGALPTLSFRLSADHTRLLLPTDGAVEIRDARSGALLRTIPGHFTGMRFLRDGRIAALEPQTLDVFSFDGVPLRQIPIGAGRPQVVTDVGAGRVVVGFRAGCAVVDVDRGVVLRRENGIRPASFGIASIPLLASTPDGVVIWNPLTGERRPIS